jgi:hypothetical protein
MKKNTTRAHAIKAGWRSGFELNINEHLKQKGIEGEYEKHVIKYIIPESNHKYTPDFKLPNGIFIESKGRFMLDDQKKHILIRAQHPDLDIRFVFQNSKAKIRKGSKTTYADWCAKHGFMFADKTIPDAWLK